jgi:hypothetical protein
VRRLRSESGQAAVELMGMLWLLFLVALAIWQLLLAAWVAEQAQNAARTATRVEGRGGDGQKAAKMALTEGLRNHSEVKSSGEKWTVKVRVPILVPFMGIDVDKFTATRDATLPSTSSGLGF